jgi:hypothetical protein
VIAAPAIAAAVRAAARTLLAGREATGTSVRRRARRQGYHATE